MAKPTVKAHPGRPFNGTARPATEEDIANIKSGDWVKLRESPFCWQFKGWENENFAIGEFEGDRFPLAKSLLMVCTVVDGEETRFYKGLPIEVSKKKKRKPKQISTLEPQPQYPEIKTKDAEFDNFLNEFEKAFETLAQGGQEDKEKFKVGDKVKIINKNFGTYGQVATVTELQPQGWVITDEPKQSLYHQSCLVKEIPEPWDLFPQSWESQGVKCSYDGVCIIWGDKKYDVTPRIKKTYVNPLTLINFLEDAWDAIALLTPLLSKPKSKSEILRAVAIKQKKVTEALGIGVDVGIFQKVGKLYQLPEKFSNNSDAWNPAHFGEVPREVEPDGQATIFFDNSEEPPEPDDFKTVKEFEEAWKQWELSHPGIYSQGEAVTAKVQLPQDIDPSGQLKTIPTLPQSTESDSPKPDSLSKTLPPSPTNLSENSLSLTLSCSQLPVPISVLLDNEPELVELAEACFLKDSDSFASNVHLHSSLKTLVESLAQIEELPSLKSSKRLQIWGIAAPGNLGMVTGTYLKTENGFSSWAITGEVKATIPKLGKKSLSEIIGEGNAIVFRAADGDRLYTQEAPTLRSLANTDGNHQGGAGAYKVREYDGEAYLERSINATEAEQLMGWEIDSTEKGINKEGDEITISQTQRIKMLGNGIIPGEITDILTAIKPIIESKLEGEVSENLRFAYRQLRQRGMSHKDSVSMLNH